MRQISLDEERDEDSEGVMPLASGLLVVHLTAGEQFVLWALRHRRADGTPASRCILHGFRLAFGLAGIEAGLAVFEGLWTLLATRAVLPVQVAPLRAAGVLQDERRLLDLLAAAQLGDKGRAMRLARGTVEERAVAQLCAYAETMAELLARRDWWLARTEIPHGSALH